MLRIRTWWESADRVQKVITMMGAALLVTLLGSTFYFASRPNMKMLFGGLSPADQGSIVTELESLGIPCEFDARGNVLVGDTHLPEARAKLALNGKLPSSGHAGYSDLSKLGIMNTPKVEQERIKVAMEGELAKSIELMSGIRSARVHLNLGDDSPFVSERKPPSASVAITESGGVEDKQAKSIARMIANAVPGLELKHISIISSQGRTLWDGQAEDGEMATSDKRRQAEIDESKRREKELQRALDKAFGAGNTVAMVTLTMDYDKKTQETFERSPTENPLKRETNEENMSGGNNQVGGVIGTTANLTTPTGPATAPATATQPNQNYKGKQVSEDFGATEKKVKIEGAPGNITSMSINVLADQNTIKDVNQVNSILHGYLGPNQGDPRFTATVTSTVFDRKAEQAALKLAEDQASQEKTQQYFSLLPIAALILVGFMAIKAIGKITPVQQITINTPAEKPKELAPRETGGNTERQLAELPQETYNDSLNSSNQSALMRELGQGKTRDNEITIESIPERLSVPLEEIKKMADERPQATAMVIKTLLAEENT